MPSPCDGGDAVIAATTFMKDKDRKLSHKGDPTIVYVLQGTLTNHHDDGTTQEFQAGQTFAEFGLRPHWVENSGATPLIFIAANIHHRQ